MIDFLILYEHKNREVENASLLLCELERRGYIVKIKCIYSLSKYYIRAKVVIVPHLYNDQQLVSFCKNFWMDNGKIISMQYEQVLRKTQRNGIHDPKGQAKYAHHLAWGKAQEDVYLAHGISKGNITVSGHIAMDLMRKEFDSLFLSRQEIADKFSLNLNKKWILFISTFSYKMMTDKEREEYSHIDAGASRQIKMSLEAQRTILEWLKQITKEHDDIIVIYRRHPAEREDPEIRKLQNEENNFRYINELTMRQWVRVVDGMYTWYSTSIADAYFGGKICHILRPKELPVDHELEIMVGANKIRTYDEFVTSLQFDAKGEFPISDNMIEYFYGMSRINEAGFAFIKTADICEKVLHSEEYWHDYDYGKSRWDMVNSGNIGMIIKCYMCGLLFELCSKVRISIPLKIQNKRILNRIVAYEREAYNVDKDIEENKKKFCSIIEKIYSSK